MAVITFDRFELGIDRRKGRAVADANRLYDLKNCYVTPGWAIQKRPGLTLVGQLSAGTKGLAAFNGELHTFSAVQDPTHGAGEGVVFQNTQLPYSVESTADIVEVHYADVFNGALYVSVEYDGDNTEHHYISGGSPYHITDVNCPHTRAVLRLAEKIVAVNGDVVDYSATGDATNWTLANDAGFLPFGLRAPGSADALALGEFDRKLAAFAEDACQIWFMDPDPSKNTLDSIIRNVGTRYPLSISPVAKDLLFLADAGFRSVALQKITNNIEDLDVGTPIDDLVAPTLVNLTSVPRSIYFSGLGQYWCAIDTTIFVYTFSRTSKVSAWSRFEYPFSIDAFAQLGTKLYVRSGDNVYLVDQDSWSDNGQSYEVLIEMAYQSFKKPGVNKILYGCDLVGKGEGELAHAFKDPDQRDKQTDFAEFEAITSQDLDTRSGPLIPVELMTTAVAPVIRNNDTNDFRLDAISYHYERLRQT